jgi:hypothetical protein
VNRLKRVHNQDFWNAKFSQKTRKSFSKRPAEHTDSSREEQFKIGSFPFVTSNYPAARAEQTTFRNQALDTPGSAQQPLDTPPFLNKEIPVTAHPKRQVRTSDNTHRTTSHQISHPNTVPRTRRRATYFLIGH